MVTRVCAYVEFPWSERNISFHRTELNLAHLFCEWGRGGHRVLYVRHPFLKRIYIYRRILSCEREFINYCRSPPMCLRNNGACDIRCACSHSNNFAHSVCDLFMIHTHTTLVGVASIRTTIQTLKINLLIFNHCLVAFNAAAGEHNERDLPFVYERADITHIMSGTYPIREPKWLHRAYAYPHVCVCVCVLLLLLHHRRSSRVVLSDRLIHRRRGHYSLNVPTVRAAVCQIHRRMPNWTNERTRTPLNTIRIHFFL